MKFLKKYTSKLQFALIATIVAFAITMGGGYLIKSLSPKLQTHSTKQNFELSSNLQVNSKNKPSPIQVFSNSSVQPTSVTPANSTIAKLAPSSSRSYFGHFAYAQADPKRIMMIASYATQKYQRFEWLAPEAGKALMEMIYAARDEGVWIVPVSGFRSIEQQQKLFQEQIQRRGSAKEAATVSAPPGYSEHHTGFAVDLTDGRFPKQDITYQFENTDAYRWLTRHAKDYDFELSFYLNNPQGVSYEPWHWRYVGSSEAVTIFAKARNLR